jgi:hypothetical protein
VNAELLTTFKDGKLKYIKNVEGIFTANKATRKAPAA